MANGLNEPGSETVSGSDQTTLAVDYAYNANGQTTQLQEYQGGALVDTVVAKSKGTRLVSAGEIKGDATRFRGGEKGATGPKKGHH